MMEANLALIEPAARTGCYAVQFTGKNRKKVRRAIPVSTRTGMPKNAAQCGALLDQGQPEVAAGHAAQLNSEGFITITSYR